MNSNEENVCVRGCVWERDREREWTMASTVSSFSPYSLLLLLDHRWLGGDLLCQKNITSVSCLPLHTWEDKKHLDVAWIERGPPEWIALSKSLFGCEEFSYKWAAIYIYIYIFFVKYWLELPFIIFGLGFRLNFLDEIGCIMIAQVVE